MIPRNSNIGENSTTLGAEYSDPAAVVEANDAATRIAAFLAALRQPYWDDAACRGVGITEFYATDQAAKARAMQRCGTCVALLPCRDEAVADKTLDFGIRGGMDVAARKNARRPR